MTLCHSALVSPRVSCESLACDLHVVETTPLVFLLEGNSRPALASSFNLPVVDTHQPLPPSPRHLLPF